MKHFFQKANHLTLLLFSLCCIPDIDGQAITISEELPLRSDYSYTILGWLGGDLLLFRDKGHEYFVQAFDEDLHLKWEREIFIGPRKADIIGTVTHEDRFHLLFGMRDKGNYIIQHRSYDHTVTLIDTMTLDVVENIFISPYYHMTASDDDSKVLLYREANNGLLLVSYDLNERNILWKNDLQFTGGNLRRDYTSMQLDNRGDFYLTLEPDKFLQKVQHLVIYSSSGPYIRNETLDLGGYQAYDFKSAYDNINDNLVICGLYSDRGTAKAQGFYTFHYRPGETPKMNISPFDTTLLTEVYGKDITSARGLSDFNVRRIALRQDGGAVIIAELNKEFSRRSSLPVRRDNGSFARGGWVDYYYEDLILFAVHPDGTEHWKKVLHKRQYSQDDEAIYSSFFLFKTPTHLRFLFNDEIKQENTVGGYEVTGTGTIERKTVFNTDYQRLKLRFKDGLQVAYNECIVPSERNNRLNLVRIKY